MKHVFKTGVWPRGWPWTVLICFLALLAVAVTASAGEEAVSEGTSSEAQETTSPGDQETKTQEEGGLINWTTTIAQIVNFLILVALLKYFLYDRITSAIDNRAKRIAGEQEEARKKQAEADKKAKKYDEELEEFEQNRQKMLEEAKAEADKLREELAQKARKEVDNTKTRWQEALRQEQEQFMQSLRTEIGQEVCTISRRAFEQLASRDLESAMIEKFLAQLHENPETLKQLVKKAGGDGLTVRSAFEISEDARKRIEQALKSNGRSVSVRFEEDKDLICGIEVRGEGNAIGWTLEKYLGEVEEDFNKMLRQSLGHE
ncbi:MAG: F0F1 ATP synthase subunit delta [Candidatus Hydrogenedentota bacterium]